MAMTMSYLVVSPSTSQPNNRTLSSSFRKLTITNPQSPLLHIPTPYSRIPKRSSFAAQSKGSNSVDAPDRLISAMVYFYPFFDGVQYGKYIITQFSPFQTLIQPLVPAIRVFKSFPFNGFLVFLTLYFVVVRNQNFSRYVRFNTMQAIVLDVMLIFPDLLERTFNPRDGVGLDMMMSLDSTVFLFLLVSLIYGSSACLLGNLPRLPIVADAADRQAMTPVYAAEASCLIHRNQHFAQDSILWDEVIISVHGETNAHPKIKIINSQVYMERQMLTQKLKL